MMDEKEQAWLRLKVFEIARDMRQEIHRGNDYWQDITEEAEPLYQWAVTGTLPEPQS